MAERDKGPYQGAVVFDATLYAKETDMKVGISLLPRIPLLFVATLRETKGAKSYLTSLVSRPDPVVPPALFLISREGHTNINPVSYTHLMSPGSWPWNTRLPGSWESTRNSIQNARTSPCMLSLIHICVSRASTSSS